MKLSFAIRMTLAATNLLLSSSAPTLLRAQSHLETHIEGRIMNGTTKEPVADQEVRLLMPRGGMQQVANTVTDSAGHFSFHQTQLDLSAFYLASTEFQRVPYNAPVRLNSAGNASVNLTVYDSTNSESDLRIASLLLLARAERSRIRVREQYTLQNSSQPPRAYANPAGTFHFRLALGVTEPTVTVTGLMNMPIPQTPEPGKSAGEFFIRYPLKPDTTTVTVEYETDYSSGGVVLTAQNSYPTDHIAMFVSPLTLSVESAVLKPTGADSQNDVRAFEAENLPPATVLEARLSGEAASGAPSGTNASEPSVKEIPDSITRLAVPLMACFLLVLLWALGVRVAREWPTLTQQRAGGPVQKKLEAKLETLLNSLADLDELFAAGKMAERNYWRERLELKAKVAAILKKSPPALLESYATRHFPR